MTSPASIPARFDWVRFWYLRGDTPTLERGFLLPPDREQMFRPSQATNLNLLPSLNTVPCLVLLGDVGMGKSVELAREAARVAKDAGLDHAVLHLDLKRLTADLIERELENSAAFRGWIEGRHELSLFLDSLDECWRRLVELGPLLIAFLKPHMSGGKAKALRLRLSCRGDEWQEELHEGLCSLFGKSPTEERVQVWQIAPLTRSNARLAAESSQVDADKFLAEIDGADTGALAAHPITLRMLLELAASGQALGRTRAELYAGGCFRLCEDTHQAVGGIRRLNSTSHERVTAAGYLAAVAVLTNRYLVAGDQDRVPTDRTGAISAPEIVGQLAKFPVGKQAITDHLLRETLQTGLFETQKAALHTWRHQSYAEFLGARYLADERIPPGELAGLLCEGASTAGKIWPQLEETACWLAVLVPEILPILAVRNPEILLRCDPVTLTPELRRKLVDAYFAEVRNSEAVVPMFKGDTPLHRLNHPELADQLAAVIGDANEKVLVRELAIDIARSCEVRALAPLFAKVLLDITTMQRLRHAAGYDLPKWADENVRYQVKATMTPEIVTEATDDVRGCVLSLLWPSHLSVDELIPLLTKPTRDNYTGSYKRFLRDRLMMGIKPTDLPALLYWVATIEHDSDQPSGDPFSGICGAIRLAGFRNLGTPEIGKAFFELLATHESGDGQLLPERKVDVEGEAALRRVFWSHIMGTELDVRTVIIYASLRESGLTQLADFSWAVEQAIAEKTRAKRWLDLVFWLFAPEQHLEHLAEMQKLDAAGLAVKARMLQYTSCLLIEDDRDNWRKTDHYRKLASDKLKKERKTFQEQIDDALDLHDSGKVGVMWGVIEALDSMNHEPDDETSNQVVLGWERISVAQRTRILALAPAYLEAIKVKVENMTDLKTVHRPYRTGLRLMLELERENSQWLANRDGDYWRQWIPVCFRYFDQVHMSGESEWAQLFGQAYRRAPGTFIPALAEWVVQRKDTYTSPKLMQSLPISTDRTLESTLLKAVAGAEALNSNSFYWCETFLQHRSTAAEELIRSWQPRADEPQTARATMADALLLWLRTATYGEAVLSRMMASREYAQAVLADLDTGGSMRVNWVEGVSMASLAKFWEFLEKEFPRDPFEENKGFGSITLDHEIYHLRTWILNYMQNCGRPDAVQPLAELQARHPNFFWLGQVVATAKHTVRRKEWNPPMVAAITTFLAAPLQAPITSEALLCDAVIASLTRFQQKLRGQNSTTELWNEPAGPVGGWSPKDENNLSDSLARHLREDLRAHRVTVARESETRQQTGSAKGDLPDLVVTAPAVGKNGGMVEVPVEVKCAWNRDVLASIGEQLHDRYMRSVPCGIHVTGYFTCPSWTRKDYRRQRSLSIKTIDAARVALKEARDKVCAKSTKRVDVVLLDARV